MKTKRDRTAPSMWFWALIGAFALLFLLARTAEQDRAAREADAQAQPTTITNRECQ